MQCRRQLSCASVMTTTWSDVDWWTRTESDRLWFCALYISSGMEHGLPTMHRSKIMKMVKNPTYKPTWENQDKLCKVLHTYMYMHLTNAEWVTTFEDEDKINPTTLTQLIKGFGRGQSNDQVQILPIKDLDSSHKHSRRKHTTDYSLVSTCRRTYS